MSAAGQDSAAPAISVLLPVHNAERYLRAAVESVLNQSCGNFELLALDDGSTDRSLAILHEFERKDGRVHVGSRENRGLVPTLNELIGQARGGYLARMDSDDICRPQRFERQLAYFESHRDCVAVGSRVLLIDPEGMPICEAANELTHDEIDAALMSAAGGVRGICHPSMTMRKDAVVRAGKYRDEYRFAEDIDFFLRLAEIGKLAALPEILLEYRQHLRSTGYSRRAEQSKAGRQAVTAARSRRGMPTAPETPASATKPTTSADVHRTWAWWALWSGHVTTARKHVLKALIEDPLNIENLRIAACAIRGR